MTENHLWEWGGTGGLRYFDGRVLWPTLWPGHQLQHPPQSVPVCPRRVWGSTFHDPCALALDPRPPVGPGTDRIVLTGVLPRPVLSRGPPRSLEGAGCEGLPLPSRVLLGPLKTLFLPRFPAPPTWQASLWCYGLSKGSCRNLGRGGEGVVVATEQQSTAGSPNCPGRRASGALL